MKNVLTFSSLSLAVASVFAASTALAVTPDSYPESYKELTAAAEKQGKVIVYSTTDTKAADPLLKAFEQQYPSIKVEYHDMNSTELYNRFISEQASGANSADIVWSSAMDSAMQLATQYSAEYTSPETPSLPDWASWNSRAYGTTFEPTAFIYNTRLIKAEEVPTSHEGLAKLVSEDTDRFRRSLSPEYVHSSRG